MSANITIVSEATWGFRFWDPQEGDDLNVVKHEPMFFRASMDYAYANGGPITRNFIDAAEGGGGLPDNAFLDSRVHMLMPGWWPCIPGWHHDDVERSRADGQPNYVDPSYRPYFVMGIVGEAHCPTEFAIGEIALEIPANGEVIYRDWHHQVEASSLERAFAQPGYLIWFDDRTFHQGTACQKGGWRWFGRITIDAPHEHANEIRRNANVYMEKPMEGW